MKRGFTLIELLVASVIFSIAALAVGSLFAAGLAMWRRVNDQRPTEQAALAMADMVERREMGRTFAPLKSEEEEPGENEWIFTGLVTGKSGLREVGEIRYQVNAKGKLLRQERTYEEFEKGEEGRRIEIGERFETLKAEDLFYDALRGEFQTEPPLGGFSEDLVRKPDAVRITLQYKAPDDKKHTLERLVRV